MKNMRELKGERQVYTRINKASDISCLKFCIKYGQVALWRKLYYSEKLL